MKTEDLKFLIEFSTKIFLRLRAIEHGLSAIIWNEDKFISEGQWVREHAEFVLTQLPQLRIKTTKEINHDTEKSIHASVITTTALSWAQ